MDELDEVGIDVSELLERDTKIEEDPKIVFDDWYKFEDEEIPVPYPHSAWYHELEKSMEMYFTKFGWVVAPIRVDRDAQGTKKLSFYKDGWKDVVPQLTSQMYALRTFATKSTCRMPANGLFLLTGRLSKVLVLDIDTPTEDGYKFIRNAGINIYADNLCAITRSGGNHFFFKWKDEYNEMITTRSKFLGKESKVDLRGNNGIIILPPSRLYDRDTDSFQQYKWDLEVQKPRIHDVPGGLHDLLIQRHRDRVKNHTDNTGYCRKEISSLTPAQQRLVRDKISEAMDSSVGYRSEKYFEVSCLFVKMAIKQDEAYTLMKDLPKIKERGREYFDMIFSAALHSVDTATYSYKSQKVSPVTSGSIESAVMQRSLSDICSDIHGYRKNRPPMDWIVPGLFGRNQISIWYAPGGLGKTIIMTETGICLASGKPLFGGCISHYTPCKVLVLHYDLNDTTYTDTYINRMRGSQNLTYYCATEFEDRGASIRLFNSTTGDMYFQELLKEVKPDWVLVDTVDAAALGMDINKQEMVQPLMFKLKKLAREASCHIALIRHPRKKGSGETASTFYSQDDLSGSDAWTRFSDYTVVFNPVKGEDGRPIKGQGFFNFAKIGVLGESIIDKVGFQIINNVQRDGSTSITVEYTSNTSEITDNTDKVILYKLNKGSMSRKDLFSALRVNRVLSESTLARKLKNLIENEYIATSGRTSLQRYQITEKGLEKLHEGDTLTSELLEDFKLPIDIAVMTKLMYRSDLNEDSVPRLVSKEEVHEDLIEEYDAIDIVTTINNLCTSGAIKCRKSEKDGEVLWITPQGLSVMRDEKYRSIIEPLLPEFQAPSLPSLEDMLPGALYLFIDIKDNKFGTKKVASSPLALFNDAFDFMLKQGWIEKLDDGYVATALGTEQIKHTCRKYINKDGAII